MFHLFIRVPDCPFAQDQYAGSDFGAEWAAEAQFAPQQRAGGGGQNWRAPQRGVQPPLQRAERGGGPMPGPQGHPGWWRWWEGGACSPVAMLKDGTAPNVCARHTGVCCFSPSLSGGLARCCPSAACPWSWGCWQPHAYSCAAPKKSLACCEPAACMLPIAGGHKVSGSSLRLYDWLGFCRGCAVHPQHFLMPHLQGGHQQGGPGGLPAAQQLPWPPLPRALAGQRGAGDLGSRPAFQAASAQVWSSPGRTWRRRARWQAPSSQRWLWSNT